MSHSWMAVNSPLLSDLSVEESEMITGGKWYKLENSSGMRVNYRINGTWQFLNPNEMRSYDFHHSPILEWDSKIGPGKEFAQVKLAPNSVNSFAKFSADGQQYLILGSTQTSDMH